MRTEIQVGDIVAAYPAGSPCRAITKARSVTDAGGGDCIVHGTWYFEDGRKGALSVYAGMCHEATDSELAKAKEACRDRKKC